jgi:HTH-type transcriptional regulator, sugar sensing transcriptional regulator
MNSAIMEKALRKFGLNNNEIKVYKACLELGSSSVTNIAKRSNVYRTLTYEVLKTLLEKGLVSYVVKDKKKYFEAASPKTFINILKEKEKMISDILPDMLKIQNSVEEKPGMTMYEGKEGIKTVLDHLVLETKEIVGFSPVKAILNILKYYAPNMFDRRVKAGIKAKLLVDGKPLRPELIEYKIIQKKVDTGFWVYNDKVLLLNFNIKNPYAIVIENKEFSEMLRFVFELAWKGAGK